MPDELVEDVDEQEEVSVREIPFSDIMDDLQQGFMLNGYSNYRIDGNQLTTSFGKLSIGKVKELKDYRFDVVRTAILIIPDEFNPTVFYNLVISNSLKGKKKPELVIIEYALENEVYTDDFDFSNYTGYIRRYSLNGEIINDIRMIAGKHATIANARTESVCGYDYVWKRTTIIVGEGDLAVTTTTWHMDIMPIDCATGIQEIDGGGQGGVSGGTPINSPIELTPMERWVKDIDDSELDPCVKDILHQLLGNTGGKLGEILNGLQTNKNFGWKLKMGSTGTAAAITSGTTSNGYLPTTFDRNYVKNATKLSIARTILHEAVHAHIVFTFGDDLVNGTSNLLFEFPVYARAIEIQNGHSLSGQHAEMAANFVNQIGSALYDYAIGAGINISPSYANDIAWGGLAQVKGFTINADGNLVIGGVDTEWFKAAIPDATIRQRINDNIENEEKGNSASKGGESGC